MAGQETLDTTAGARRYAAGMPAHPPAAHAADELVGVRSSIRRYDGRHLRHSHGYAQVMFALQGRMELEIAGRTLVADASSGVVVPAGFEHGYCAGETARMLVIDAPEAAGLARVRRFAVTMDCLRRVRADDPAAALEAMLGAPAVLARRTLDLARLEAAVDAALHEDWPTARLAALCCLSAQRFHARLLELTGRTPQAWLRERRLDVAARLLRRGLALEAAAARTGYASASALCFALRRDRRTGARALRAP
jgi:AraC-like DNA-binding protein/mannose-6-phosphate isomerase-like protein (cupin superfamily)